MFILANELRVQTTQFDASVIGRELPVDVGGTKVAVGFPSDNLVRQATAELEPPEDVQWIVDVDPVEML